MKSRLTDAANDLPARVNNDAVRTDGGLPDKPLQTFSADSSCEVPRTAIARVLAQRVSAPDRNA
jgi:hypothetical protein